jgi:hypothetical protein
LRFKDKDICYLFIPNGYLGINSYLEKSNNEQQLCKDRTSIMLNVERKAFWPSSLFCDDSLKTRSASLLDNHTN